mmetsp:Transcript_24681/g.51686  ORF Transcript_24681/g.51686 Transcript_24681/m.51686 type:complete len:127 (+) Transcript_24681:500-880(+)
MRTRIWTGKGEDCALGFLEKAFGSMFMWADVRASKMPNMRRSLTLYRKMDEPGLMPEAAIFICAGNPKSPLPKHSSIVCELHPKINPGPGIVGQAISSGGGHRKSVKIASPTGGGGRPLMLFPSSS